MTAPTFPQVFTFYSYKGGVGRSMALMNVAYKLASWGRHVLMVDMDLEAPGISGFLQRNGELDPPPAGSKDVITLVAEVKRLSSVSDSAEELAEQLPPLSNFLRSVKRENLTTLQPELGSLGRLDLLGPDLNRNYEDRFAGLGLAGISQAELVAMSRILHFYFKAERFPFLPEWLNDMETARPTPYDYVLVDSRTGITEIGGLCVGPLADALVVVTGLNDQNVKGTQTFLSITGIHPMPKSGVDSAPDDEDSVSKTLGPKPTIMVASPVPNGELESRKKRLGELQKVLGTKPLRLSYHPQQALMETLFVRDQPDEYLALEYSILANLILNVARDSAKSLEPLMRDLQESKTTTAAVIPLVIRHAPQNPDLASSLLAAIYTPDAFTDAIRITSFLAQSKRRQKVAMANLANALSRQAKIKSGAEADRLYTLSNEKYEEAIRRHPAQPSAWNNWGASLGDQALRKTGAEADQLFALATEKYQEAIRLEPNLALAWNNWGVTLSDQADKNAGKEADRYYALSSEKFQQAVRLQPDFAQAWYNWGKVLSAQAKGSSGVEVDRIYELSSEKHQEAVRLQPNLAEAWNNWGSALSDQANMKTGPEADRLYALSIEKHREAIRFQPGLAVAWSNWGATLGDQASAKVGAEADHLYTSSVEKYQEAIRLQPDLATAWSNWGVTLSERAKTKSGAEADQLYALSNEKYQQAIRLQPDHAPSWSNWGIMLSEHAKTTTGSEADRLLSLSNQKYQEALRLQPNDARARSNWAANLMIAARTAPAEQSEALLAQAREHLTNALSIQPKSADYNLACLEAIEQNVDEAIRWLQAAKANGNVKSKLQLAQEPDFNEIRSTPAFFALIADLPDR